MNMIVIELTIGDVTWEWSKEPPEKRWICVRTEAGTWDRRSSLDQDSLAGVSSAMEGLINDAYRS